MFFFFFSSRRRHTRLVSDWSSDVCSSDLQAVKAGYRDAVVPVQDEVGAVQFVEGHRRQILAPVERYVDALPPLARARAQGQEATVEVLAASHAPHNLFGIHYAPSPAYPVVCSERVLQVLERSRCANGLPAKTQGKFPYPGFAPGEAEVLVRLLVEIHQ